MEKQIILDDVLSLVLSGDTLGSARDFTAFLRENGFQIEHNRDENDENKWSGAIGGIVGNSIGYMYVNPGANFPDPWTIWLNEIDYYSGGSADDDEMKNFVWEHVNHCSRCNPNWEKCGGGEKTVFGKTFDRLCHSPMYFYMPDAHTLAKLKMLMLKIMQNKKSCD
jgi:hypothetical protein